MMNIIVTALLLQVLIFTMTLISAVHGWTIHNNPTAAVDVPSVRQQRSQQRQSQRLFVLSAISVSSSTDTDTTEVDCNQQQQQQQQDNGEYDYDECIMDEDMLLSDCVDFKSFISSAISTATAAVPDTDHTTTTATTATTDHSIIDTIYVQLHDNQGKSLLSTIIIPTSEATFEKRSPRI